MCVITDGGLGGVCYFFLLPPAQWQSQAFVDAARLFREPFPQPRGPGESSACPGLLVRFRPAVPRRWQRAVSLAGTQGSGAAATSSVRAAGAAGRMALLWPGERALRSAGGRAVWGGAGPRSPGGGNGSRWPRPPRVARETARLGANSAPGRGAAAPASREPCARAGTTAPSRPRGAGCRSQWGGGRRGGRGRPGPIGRGQLRRRKRSSVLGGGCGRAPRGQVTPPAARSAPRSPGEGRRAAAGKGRGRARAWRQRRRAGRPAEAAGREGEGGGVGPLRGVRTAAGAGRGGGERGWGRRGRAGPGGPRSVREGRPLALPRSREHPGPAAPHGRAGLGRQGRPSLAIAALPGIGWLPREVIRTGAPDWLRGPALHWSARRGRAGIGAGTGAPLAPRPMSGPGAGGGACRGRRRGAARGRCDAT